MLDDDAHVECKNRWDLAVTVQLCLRFSEQARDRCDAAWDNLENALERAQRSLVYLERTSNTLAQAIRLQAMGRR